MKIIFLDIDGVLNNEIMYIPDYENKFRNESYPISSFDSQCVDRLNRIVRATGARIVLSSSWRLDETETLKNIFRKVGMPLFFDKTPYLFDNEPLKGGSRYIKRGEEIKAWLDKQTLPVEYIILDDDNDMLEEQMDRLVHCDSYYGLSDVDVDKAISLLGSLKDDYKKFFGGLKEFSDVDDIPDIPIIDNEDDYKKIVVENLIRCGAISKKDLVKGKTYIGTCRNASEAIWDGEMFIYSRNKFGFVYEEKIEHFEDFVESDMFVPIKEKGDNELCHQNQ